MKEWLLKFVVHEVWRRRKGWYYAVSVVSIVGNLVVLVGPAVQSSVVLHRGAFQAAWSALPQVAELVLHRSVLYILLNLIVVRIVVKSGVLRHPAQALPAKVDEFCVPSNWYVVRSLPWPAPNNYSVYETQAAHCATMLPDPYMWLQSAQGDHQTKATIDLSAQTPALHRQSINKPCHATQPKCAPAPSLFTIEPLDEQSAENYTLNKDEAHNDKTLKHPLRKVVSRRADLHCSVRVSGAISENSMKVELAQQKDEQSMQLVLAKQEVHGGETNSALTEHEDNKLSRQEFNKRVDTFIFKFKRSLTIQRQDSRNRLLGLVGGGGDIRVIK